MSDSDGKAVHKEQFTSLQALRGLAALWVVLYQIHKSQVIPLLAERLWPPLVSWVFTYGRGGVAVFFVLSGFVITHSLWQTTPNSRSVGSFLLRRSIRLDPAYWASILLTLAVSLALALYHEQEISWPNAETLLAHIFYIQEILKVDELQPVYWTLTYEVQFYLIFILALWLYSWIARRSVFLAAMVPTFFIILAFISAAQITEWAPHGLFVNYWQAFAAGSLAYVAGYIRKNPFVLFALAGTMLISANFIQEIFNAPAAITAILLFIMARTSTLFKGLIGKAIQWLGMISYSLYLIHMPVIRLTTGSLNKIIPGTIFGQTLMLAIILVNCFILSTLFWLAIERPTHLLARRIRRTAD